MIPRHRQRRREINLQMINQVPVLRSQPVESTSETDGDEKKKAKSDRERERKGESLRLSLDTRFPIDMQIAEHYHAVILPR